MFSAFVTQVPRSNTASLLKVTYEDGASAQEFHGSGADYFMTHTLPPAKTKTMFAPPLHYHMNQTEYFRIVSGEGRFYLSGKTISARQNDVVTIPIGAYHRFENARDEKPLVVDITLDPHKPEQDVSFFRNFFGYLEDCRVHKMQPSLFQLLRFLHAVDGPLSIMPAGPEAFRNWCDWAFMIFFGVVVGEWLLGYQGSYPEYYKPRAA